jgi:hypothetical protein
MKLSDALEWGWASARQHGVALIGFWVSQGVLDAIAKELADLPGARIHADVIHLPASKKWPDGFAFRLSESLTERGVVPVFDGPLRFDIEEIDFS